MSVPKHGGKRHNLASTFKRRISSYPTGQPVKASANSTPVEHRQTNSTPTISQAVSAKLKDENVRAALRILVLDDSPVIPSPQSLNAMLEKHPPSSTTTDLPAPDPQQCISVEESEVPQAVFFISYWLSGRSRLVNEP